ncbi:hypothetical protein MCAMS1_01472 [biofilm metagenome]
MRVLTLIFTLFATQVNASVLQFLYIEASEGSSSGGHVALQLDDTVFHYQYDDGLIRLFKHNAEDFRVNYQLKQNRTIHVADVGILDSAFSQLKNHFNLKYFEQKQAIKKIESARNNHAILVELLRQHGEDVHSQLPALSLKLPVAGLFYADPKTAAGITDRACPTEVASATILKEVKRQLENRYGKSFLSHKQRELRRLIGGLKPSTTSRNLYGFSEQYADLLTGSLALQVIEKTRPLTASACFQVNLPELKLTDAAIKQATAYRQTLLNTAQALLVSKRPDWGYALLVTLARLVAIEQSIQVGHWVFLDDSDDENSGIDTEQAALYVDFLHKYRARDTLGLINAASEFLNQSAASDLEYANFEMAANRYQQWLGRDKAGEIKYRGDTALPTKSIPAINYLVTDLPKDRLVAALQNQEKAVKHLLDEDQGHNKYHLLTKNCVTVLFEQVNAAINGQSITLLGGYINPKNTIIPFQAFDAVQDNYNVIGTKELPAYRHQALAKLYRREVGSWVYLRESNVFSSSLYRHNPDDAWFVFFTDDAIVTRPLYGAINIVAAASQSVWGLVSWPFGGEHEDITIGARGVLASLPELAFFNIRKGSYPYPINPKLAD